jgi:hypothetical protein
MLGAATDKAVANNLINMCRIAINGRTGRLAYKAARIEAQKFEPLRFEEE